jgi:cyanophycin synthetase
MFFNARSDPATQQLTQAAAGMSVTEVGVYRGPHYYSHRPMIRIQLDLGSLEEWPTNRIPGFTERLLELLPGVGRHGCSLKVRGGFERRLRAGTWLGHVAEHVALELQTLAGSRATRGKTRSVKNRPGVYNVMFAYNEEKVGLAAGRVALELVNSLLPPDLEGLRGLDRIYADLRGDFDLERRLDALKRLVRRTALGPTTRSLVEEAQRRGIPVMRLRTEGRSLIQLGHGEFQQKIAPRSPAAPRRRDRARQRQDMIQEAARRERRAGSPRRGGTARSRAGGAAARAAGAILVGPSR